MIFVDSSAWIAAMIPGDSDHAAAVAWLASNHESLAVTDYIFDETVTLLRARGQHVRATEWGDAILSGEIASLHRLDETDSRSAWAVFSHFADKDWSFTDCTSKVVIERVRITTAFAFDHHFRQFGSVAVTP